MKVWIFVLAAGCAAAPPPGPQAAPEGERAEAEQADAVAEVVLPSDDVDCGQYLQGEIPELLRGFGAIDGTVIRRISTIEDARFPGLEHQTWLDTFPQADASEVLALALRADADGAFDEHCAGDHCSALAQWARGARRFELGVGSSSSGGVNVELTCAQPSVEPLTIARAASLGLVPEFVPAELVSALGTTELLGVRVMYLGRSLDWIVDGERALFQRGRAAFARAGFELSRADDGSLSGPGPDGIEGTVQSVNGRTMLVVTPTP